MDFERNFLMDGFRKAIGNMPEAKLRFAAMGWYEKGYLEKEDLEEIDALIKAQNGTHDEGVEVTDEAADI